MAIIVYKTLKLESMVKKSIMENHTLFAVVTLTRSTPSLISILS